MTPLFKIINPAEYPGWDELLPAGPDGSFFHTAAWARVLQASYGYRPLYFSTIAKGALTRLVPLMEVNSFLTGKRGVSLPFTDVCPLIAPGGQPLQPVLSQLTQYGKKAGWKYIQFRTPDGWLMGRPSCAQYYTHTLDLTRGRAAILAGVRGSTRRNIKKAEKTGMRVEVSNTAAALQAFCDLNCMTRKVHGLPPQPRRFFKQVYDQIIAPQKGIVVVAFTQRRPIAGAVYFHFGRQATYKYGASDRRYQHLRPNNRVMWEAIRWYADRGFASLSFGRTEPGNQGLLQFKRGWGVREEKINYYRYDLKNDCFVHRPKRLNSSYGFFKKMPAPLLKLTGTILYRHVG